MTVATSTYTAYRGYAWSHVPDFTSVERLNELYRFVSRARGDFPDPVAVTLGVVSNGTTVGFFVIQNVAGWDAEGRACDYAAFALLPAGQAAAIDFVSLINHDFFWTPSHTPPRALHYDGLPSAPEPVPAVIRLMKDRVCSLDNPSSVGSLVAKYGFRSPRWVGFMQDDGTMRVECDSWRLDQGGTYR